MERKFIKILKFTICIISLLLTALTASQAQSICHNTSWSSTCGVYNLGGGGLLWSTRSCGEIGGAEIHNDQKGNYADILLKPECEFGEKKICAMPDWIKPKAECGTFKNQNIRWVDEQTLCPEKSMPLTGNDFNALKPIFDKPACQLK